MTYEDPVENKIPGLAQSQVRADIGYTFAAGLRAGLRQDPDVIMVGEIRDAETLEMAMESAMTGHLVFSTVHTNSAAETITRVLNLGAAPYMIAGTFNLVMAQRLVRRNCTHCQCDHQLDPEIHQHVRAAFAHFDQEKLKQELLSRSITQEQWKRIIADATISIGSGQAADGTTCPHCDGT